MNISVRNRKNTKWTMNCPINSDINFILHFSVLYPDYNFTCLLVKKLYCKGVPWVLWVLQCSSHDQWCLKLNSSGMLSIKKYSLLPIRNASASKVVCSVLWPRQLQVNVIKKKQNIFRLQTFVKVTSVLV